MCGGRPLSYKEFTSGALKTFEEQRILNIVNDDYYYSNVIARASKTMLECKNSKINLKSTGTEG